MDKAWIRNKKIDLKKVLKQVIRLKELAKKEIWQLYYDSELDSLYFIPEKLPKDVVLMDLGGDYNLYLSEESNLHGIFIEYFKSNYLMHEKELKDIKDIFTVKIDGLNTVPNTKAVYVQKFEDFVEKDLLEEIIQEQKISL